MPDMSWIDAIAKILKEEKKPIYYTEIAELIAERGYRTSLGATPANTVNAYISSDINRRKGKSQFVRTERGTYMLREAIQEIEQEEVEQLEEKPNLIAGYGVYWDRNKVNWKSPKILGSELNNSTTIDFSKQIGIYLLHDIRETIYIGQATNLGERLKQHTANRMSGRWNRFSWFGFYPVDQNGKLNERKDSIFNFDFKTLLDTLESLLIETIEPRQNRKSGNNFNAVEYLQEEDGEFENLKTQNALLELIKKG